MTDLERILPDATPPAGARERVRAGIAGRVERARRRRTIAGYGAVIAAAMIAVAAMSILRNRDTPAESAAGAPLGAGVIELPSRARVLIQPGAATSLVRDDATGTLLRVERGIILAKVEKRAPGRPFVVVAGDVRVEVVGTTFAVGVGLDGAVGVRGYEGSVRVLGRGIDSRVGAGDAWPTPARAPVLDDAALAEVAMVARIAPSPPPAPDAGLADATTVTSAPEAGLPDTTPVTPAPGDTGDRAHATASPVRAYTAAKQLEEAGDLKRALAAYQAITSGPRAEDALYAVGRLQHGVLREPDAALATLTAYRKQYPRGRYARAVDVHILDLAIARGDHEAMEREASSFLTEHAGDPVAPRFRIARASARVHRGDCDGALADLRQLPRSAVTAELAARCGR